MKIAFVSAFRNCAQHVPRYFQQVAGLYFLLDERGHRPYLLIGEGDSDDHTPAMLLSGMQKLGLAGKILDVSHGGPSFGSIINTQRFAQLAAVYNTLWTHIPDDAGAVVFVEGDLIWQPAVMAEMVDRLDRFPAVAAMVFHAPGCTLYGRDPNVRWFYDRWGFAAQGEHFTNAPPYHPSVNGKPVALDSAGSCVVMREGVARRVHFPAENMVQGMTQMLAANGTPVWLQPDLIVEHPN